MDKNIEKHLDEFSAWFGQKSPGTRKMYLHHLKGLFEYTGKESLSKQEIVDYLKMKNEKIINISKKQGWEVERQKLSKSTVALFFSALTRYYNFREMFDKANMIINLRKDYLSRGVEKMDVVTLSISEVKELMMTVVKNNEFMIERDELIIRFLYTTGVRESELCNLTIDDIKLKDCSDKIISIIGKGNKRRFIKIDGYTLKLYKKHRENHDEWYQNTKFLFVNRFYRRLKPYSVWEIVKNKARKINLIKNKKAISPHKLRSTFATSMKDEDLLKRQELMGHSSPATTRLYTAFQEKDLMKVKTPSSKELD